MDFFQHQEDARRQSAALVVMFIVAVVGMVLALDAAGALVFVLARWKVHKTLRLDDIPTVVYVITTIGALSTIAIGWLKARAELSGGGVAIADLVGARYVPRNTKDELERRLVNVVEEMALASGMAVPFVYVLDREDAINAFAAGESADQAVITVTRGALEQLDREELQGIVAHEFSHILNGDMRMNFRLIGVLAGLVLIGSTGTALARAGAGSGERSAWTGRRSGGGGAWLAVAGVLLAVVGSAGLLAGRLIRAAIARRRELLADASSVQFTRNPDGLARALTKAGTASSFIHAYRAEELSHMFFSQGIYTTFDWLNTHPPVQDRVQRLVGPRGADMLRQRQTQVQRADRIPPLFQPPPAPGERVRTTAQEIIQSVGRPGGGHVEFTRAALAALPADLREAAANQARAPALLYALLLGDASQQKSRLPLIGDPTLTEEAARLADALPAADARAPMLLFELALPTLRSLALPAQDEILETAQRLVHTAGQETLREFVLVMICKVRLGTHAKQASAGPSRTLGEVAVPIHCVLSLLAHVGGGGQRAYDKGIASLAMRRQELSPPGLRPMEIEKSLQAIRAVTPVKKPLVILACLEVVMADGHITVEEADLMRAICALLDSPLPPVIERQAA